MTSATSFAFGPAQTKRSGAPGAPSGGSASSRGWRCGGPAGGVVVSARITIGASRPLAPCTVITRTSSRVISMSRFTSVLAARSQATKPCSEGVSRRS